MRWLTLAAYAAITVVLTFVVAIASRFPLKPGYARGYLSGPAFLDGWARFDADWYWSIAQFGYSYTPGRQSSIAFFPTYPMFIRGLGSVIGDYQVAGSVLTVVAAASSVVLFAGWTQRRLPRGAVFTAVALLLLYPYSFFLYGAVYADAVFLLTAVGAFVLLDRGDYWLAGLVGALATAGRPVGVAVAVGLVVRMLEIRAQQVAGPQDDGTLSARRVPFAALLRAVPTVRWRQVGVLVSGLGLLGWTTYLWIAFGNPLAFVAAEAAPGWDQGSGPKTWFKVAFVGTVLHGPHGVALALLAQAAFALIAVLLLPRVLRLFGWGYFAFSVVVIAIPIIGTKDFMGTGRYLLAAFPIVAAGGDWLAANRYRGWLRPLVLVLFAAGLVFAASLYARVYEVS